MLIFAFASSVKLKWLRLKNLKISCPLERLLNYRGRPFTRLGAILSDSFDSVKSWVCN